MCERLQKAASLLEGRLAELENWSTEAQEVCHHLKERQHRGNRGPHPRTKVSTVNKVMEFIWLIKTALSHCCLFRFPLQALISRGLLLEGQVVTEGEDLQVFVTSVQKNPSVPYLSTSAIQDRLKRTVSHCQVNFIAGQYRLRNA